MKVRHLFLGIALVALVAACDKKEAPVETPTETVIETPVVEVVETPAAEVVAPAPKPAPKPVAKPVAKPAAKPAPKAEAPKVDPCEKIVSECEAFATRISNAQKRKGANPDALKEWMALKKEANTMNEKAKGCVENPTYKTRVQQTVIAIKNAM